MHSNYVLSHTSVAVALALSALSSGLWAADVVDLGSSNVVISNTQNYDGKDVKAGADVTVSANGSLTTGSFNGSGKLTVQTGGSMTSSGSVSASRFENGGTFKGSDVTASTSQYMYNNGNAELSGSMKNEATNGVIKNTGTLSVAGNIETQFQLNQVAGNLTLCGTQKQEIDTLVSRTKRNTPDYTGVGF